MATTIIGVLAEVCMKVARPRTVDADDGVLLLPLFSGRRLGLAKRAKFSQLLSVGQSTAVPFLVAHGIGRYISNSISIQRRSSEKVQPNRPFCHYAINKPMIRPNTRSICS